MSQEKLVVENLNVEVSETEFDEPEEYGEALEYDDFDIPTDESLRTESSEKKEWEHIGEYGEAKKFYVFAGEGAELPEVLGEYGSEVAPTVLTEAIEVEETEEEKELRREREILIDEVKQIIMERMLLRRRNAFLQKKLVELYKKRRMENVLNEESKGLDHENKYLKRLYAFKEFKQSQEMEIEELNKTMRQYETGTKMLEEELEEKLKYFVTRAKEVSLNLILSKTGKKINEKTVDRLLRRQILKNEEKGKKKLQYIKIKKLIEEKEVQLKAMQYFGEGLHIADYEQMKIDNQNFTDKIEEKEDELRKMRLKTQGIIQNLAHVREKAYAIEGDIELMEEKVYGVENIFAETREKLTNARKKRDFLREEFSRLKSVSGLLTRSELLRDFEKAINEVNSLQKNLISIRKTMSEKNKQESELAKIVVNSTTSQIQMKKLFYNPSTSWQLDSRS